MLAWQWISQLDMVTNLGTSRSMSQSTCSRVTQDFELETRILSVQDGPCDSGLRGWAVGAATGWAMGEGGWVIENGWLEHWAVLS